MKKITLSILLLSSIPCLKAMEGSRPLTVDQLKELYSEQVENLITCIKGYVFHVTVSRQLTNLKEIKLDDTSKKDCWNTHSSQVLAEAQAACEETLAFSNRIQSENAAFIVEKGQNENNVKVKLLDAYYHKAHINRVNALMNAGSVTKFDNEINDRSHLYE